MSEVAALAEQRAALERERAALEREIAVLRRPVVVSTAERVRAALELEQEATAYPHRRAQNLTHAAGEWQLAGDDERARILYREAITDGGPVSGDARNFYADLLFELGEDDAARQQLDELAASGPADSLVFVCAAEVLEAHGDLSAGLRWADAGVARVLPDLYSCETSADLNNDPASDLRFAVTVLQVRRRLRVALGHPSDDLDDLAVRLASSRRA